MFHAILDAITLENNRKSFLLTLPISLCFFAVAYSLVVKTQSIVGTFGAFAGMAFGLLALGYLQGGLCMAARGSLEADSDYLEDFKDGAKEYGPKIFVLFFLYLIFQETLPHIGRYLIAQKIMVKQIPYIFAVVKILVGAWIAIGSVAIVALDTGVLKSLIVVVGTLLARPVKSTIWLLTIVFLVFTFSFIVAATFNLGVIGLVVKILVLAYLWAVGTVVTMLYFAQYVPEAFIDD